MLTLVRAAPAQTQQAVRVKIDGLHHKIDLPAQLYRPAKTPAPAVAIFYGCGGVGLLRTLSSRTDIRVPGGWRAAILVYPDCALAEAMGPKLRPRLPTMMAMGELDDWTPVKQCDALLERVKVKRNLVETHVYARAHHSFDALGLPVRHLEGVGNRSKPGGCCGAHYGASEAAWNAFTADTKAFLARHLQK